MTKFYIILSFIIPKFHMSGSSFLLETISWNNVSELGSKIVPPLTRDLYKGQMGKIGILGGSKLYTGAPFYAGLSALKFGADLSYLLC